MVDSVGLALAGVLSGACPTLAVISEQSGQHEIYNCFVELKMATDASACSQGSCIGSAHITDMRSNSSVTINVVGNGCNMTETANAATFFKDELSIGNVRIEEYLGLAVGADGRLLIVSGFRNQTASDTEVGTRVECRGQNPVRRSLDRAR